jgi:hypothetical protein
MIFMLQTFSAVEVNFKSKVLIQLNSFKHKILIY